MNLIELYNYVLASWRQANDDVQRSVDAGYPVEITNLISRRRYVLRMIGIRFAKILGRDWSEDTNNS